MSIVVPLVATMLAAAALTAVFRLLRGPTTLDRVVATDMLLAIMLCGLAALAAARVDETIPPVILVGTVLGFVGSLVVARMFWRRDP